MEIQPLAIPDVLLIRPEKHGDHRGFVSEVYSKRDFAAAGITIDFVQDNHSFSAQPGTLRGLHFQAPPFAQNKLVRATRGRILDVAVDIRRASPTFGAYVAAELSAENWEQMLVPAGFAHGFVTLEPDTEVLYKLSQYYAPEHERGVAWDDPALAISWPIAREAVTLSERDTKWPRLADAPVLFD